MPPEFKIDSLDQKILHELRKNARTPYLEIARICGVSGSAIHQRIQKLEESGVIQGSTVILNTQRLGYKTCAFVGVFLDKGNKYKVVADQIEKITEVVECHYTTGNYAIFLKIYAKDNQHLMNILNGKIQNIPGISRTETYISLEQSIDRQVGI